MPLLDEAAFEGHETVRIFVAENVREGRRAEAALDAQDIEYFVRVEVHGRTLFGSPRRFAAFFVDTTEAEACESALRDAGLGFGIVHDQAHGNDPAGS